MRSLNPDAFIDTLGPRWYKLRRILDENDRWASLLEVLPLGNDCNEIERLAKDAQQRPSTSPAEVLLWRLASKRVTVQMIKNRLEEMQLERALCVLKDDVPLQIVKQPCQYLEIQEGKELELVCLAEACPEPEYQWFKNDEENELEGQNWPTLRIPYAQLQDDGIYTCRVHTCYMDGDLDYTFSTFSRVVVVPSGVRSALSQTQAYLPQLQSSRILLDDVEAVSNIAGLKNLQISAREFENYSTAKIIEQNKKTIRDLQIIKHPVSPGIINPGATVVLECKARSSMPIRYEWYCNGLKMPGETSSELKLSNLYPDTYSGEYYICEVQTEAEKLYSASASVQLSSFNKNTQYFAADKNALLIANNIYEELDDLIVPPNDVATLSAQLKSIGFKVIVLMNLNLIEMKKNVYVFCGSLRKGSYGLVYYAGHGFEQFGQSYFQPVDASESCLPEECVCVEELLQNMQEKEPALSVLLIDMCRKLPKQFRGGESIQPGKIYEPVMKRNVVYGYATSFLCAAYENNKSPNGYFMKYLKEHITKKQCILDVLWGVRCDFENDRAVRNLQYPWVGSSLTAPRKLTDTVNEETSDIVADDVTWKDIQSSPFPNVLVRIPVLAAHVLLEFHPHKEQFCNAADLYLYIEPENKTTCANVFSQFDVEFRFNSENICHNVLPPPDMSNESRICCCIIEIFDLQKIESNLRGTLQINNRQTGIKIAEMEIPHDFVQPPVSKLQCTEFWQRLHNTATEDSSHRLMMNIELSDDCHVQNHYTEPYEAEEDLISFADEIDYSTNYSSDE